MPSVEAFESGGIVNLVGKIKGWVADNFTPDPLSAYPIGSIYMSVTEMNPHDIFGGTWERITGSFLLAATDNGNSGASQAAGRTGGAATVTLTSAQSGSPAHKHTVPQHGHGFTQPTVNGGATTTGGGGSHSHSVMADANNSKTYMYWNTGGSNSSKWSPSGSWIGSSAPMYAVGVGNHTHSQVAHTHSVSGGAVSDKAAFDTNNSTAVNASEAHENMPPYLSVYVWKRTA